MNPTSQHQFGLSRAVTEQKPASALSPSPSTPLIALQQQQQHQQPNLQQLQWLPHPGVSCGSISSDHIRWVTSLRLRKGRWLSEMQQVRWTQTENDYYEFTFELFQSGFLKGVEVGLPFRYFMSELLGCSVQRIDQKLMEDKRVPDLRCPHHPQRELVDCERQGLIKKLHRLERAFLMREKAPLLSRVRYNSPEDASRFIRLLYSPPQEVDQDHLSGATSTSSAARPSCKVTSTPGISSTEAAQGKIGCVSGYSSSAAGVVTSTRAAAATAAAASPSMTMSETVSSAEGMRLANSASRPTQKTTSSGPSSSHNDAACGTEGGGLRQTSSQAGLTVSGTSVPSTHTGGFTMLDLLSATGARINEMRQTSLSASKSSHQTGLVDDAGGNKSQQQTAESLMTAVDTSAVVESHSEVEALDDGQSRTASGAESSIHTTGAACTTSVPSATGAVGNAFQQKIPSNQTKTTTTPELFEDSNRRPRVSTPEALPHKGKAKQTEVLQQSQGQQVSGLRKKQGQHKAACVNPPSLPVDDNHGDAIGLNVLGVRKESPGQGPPPAKRRVSNGGVSQDSKSRSSVSDMDDANGRDCMPDSAEDEAAMEYLKWELHGKFMAFPGEHYHNLLSCLASEIYHNRYPVEYGVDVLHAVMREAGPGAAKKFTHTLKMNVPTKVT